MATEKFFQDVEAIIQLLMNGRDIQRSVDQLVTDGLITGQQRTNVETRLNTYFQNARQAIAALSRDAV